MGGGCIFVSATWGNSGKQPNLLCGYGQNAGWSWSVVGDGGSEDDLQVLMAPIELCSLRDYLHQLWVGEELPCGLSTVGIESTDHDHHMTGFGVSGTRDEREVLQHRTMGAPHVSAWLIGGPTPGSRGRVIGVLDIDEVFLGIERQAIAQLVGQAQTPFIVEGAYQDDCTLSEIGKRSGGFPADQDF